MAGSEASISEGAGECIAMTSGGRSRSRRSTLVVILATLAAAGLGASWWWFAGRRTDDPIARGLAAYERHDWPSATASARERLHESRDDVEAWRLLARSAARLGRDENAQKIYADRVGMGRMAGEDFYVLGLGLQRQSRSSEALTVMADGLSRDPRHTGLLLDLTRLYARRDDLDVALHLAERLADLPGWGPRGDVLAGILLAELGDPGRAGDHLERALKRDPRLLDTQMTPTSARKLLARMRLRSGKAAEANAVLDGLLAREDDPEAYWLLSRARLQQDDPAGASAALKRSDRYVDETEFAHEAAPFVGSAACASCHAEIHRSQQSSLHARTFLGPDDLARLPLADRPVNDPDRPGVVHTMNRQGDRATVETRVDNAVFRAVVEYVLGSGDRGLTMVGRDASGRPCELRLSRYHDGSGWDRTAGHPQRPPDPSGYLGLPLPADALRRCIDCHTTDARAVLDRRGPTVQDRGIGCERCHGPGGNHLKAVAVKDVFPDTAIGRPRQLSALRQVQLCGECHSPRGVEVVDTDEPGNVRFQASTFVKSRCFTESQGALSCVTCHNPHRDATAAPAFYEAKCLDCHAPAARSSGRPRVVADPCPINPRAGCIGCHMPVVKDAVPHSPFSSHHIRIHR